MTWEDGSHTISAAPAEQRPAPPSLARVAEQLPAPGRWAPPCDECQSEPQVKLAMFMPVAGYGAYAARLCAGCYNALQTQGSLPNIYRAAVGAEHAAFMARGTGR